MSPGSRRPPRRPHPPSHHAKTRAKATEEEALFARFIANKKVLIADASAATRAAIAKILRNLDVPTAHIRLAGNHETAVAEIRSVHPHVIIANYQLGDEPGLELINLQRRYRAAEES